MPNQRAKGVTPRTVAIPDEVWARVQEASMRFEVSCSAIVRWAIEEHLAKNGH